MRKLMLVLLTAVLPPGLSAQSADVPLHNWTVPPYTHSSAGGITTMTDVTPPRAFIGIQPCRVADTRGNGAPITGGIFANSQQRTWDVTGICGIPAGADAISVNFSVVSPAGTPLGAFLLAWPTGQAAPPTALMTYGPGATVISNAAIVPLGPSEQLNVNVSHSTHVIMDVNGYFSDALQNGQNFLELTTNSTQFAAFFRNTNAACGDACGVSSWVDSSSSGSIAVLGYATSSSGYHYGVKGIVQDVNPGGAGVLGDSGAGVGGLPDLPAGVLGRAGSVASLPVVGIGDYEGVRGINTAGATSTVASFGSLGWDDGIGIFGQTSVSAGGAAGIFGLDGGGAVPPGALGFSAGVRGESAGGGSGVLGQVSNYFGIGVNGQFLDSVTGVRLSAGYLGYNGVVGVFYDNGLAGTGTKSFIEPHPTDASKAIRYVSLEGNEAGTYFRGRGKFQNGIAVIEPPEDFRMVTDRDSLSIQVTPIGQMATVAVESIGLDRIVVRGSRNVEFFYTVNGVRRAYKSVQTIVENEKFFVPDSPNARIPAYLSADERQRLIDNGTYKPDGTVNVETAVRLGWDRKWSGREGPKPLSVKQLKQNGE